MKSERIWTVTEINAAIRELVEKALVPFWIGGEVGTLNIHRSGHVYFTLKDETCQMRAVFFRGASVARELGLHVGMQVEAYGEITVYEARGEYQMLVRNIRPLGVGDLQRRFDELKNRLEREGLFDSARKKEIPLLPERIGVVTSPEGAAIRDFLQIVERRFPGLRIRIYPAACQGRGAEKELAAGVEFFNRAGDVDVIVVTRGGGSIEDLWPFNEEFLARSIAASRVPVVSAVGHEIDFTICDFVADLRVPTPSAAAELVVGKRDEFLENIARLRKCMIKASRFYLERASRRCDAAAKSYVFREPARWIRERQQCIDDTVKSMEAKLTAKIDSAEHALLLLRARLSGAFPSSLFGDRKGRLTELIRRSASVARNRIENRTLALAQLKARLDSVNPANVIARGYALIVDPETGKIVTDPEITPGKRLVARVAGGLIEIEVRSGRRGKTDFRDYL